MRVYDRYLATLALLFTTTTVLLAFYNQHQIDLYFSLYLIELLAVTLIFAHLIPRARGFLGFIGVLLFGGFLAIVVMKVLEILVGSGTFL